MLVYGNVPKVQPQMRDLTPFTKRDRFPEKDFFPPSIEQYRYKGNSFAMPYDLPIRCFWYNAALFRERGVTLPPANWDDPGWSWNDFTESARRLTRVEPNPADSVWGVRWGVDMPALFVMGGSAWVVPQSNTNPEEAWELVQHLISPEVERAQIKHVGIMPARRAVMEEYGAQEPPKNMKMVLRGAETCQLLPKSPWWPEAEQIAKPILDELWTGARSPSAAAQEIKRLVDEQLKQPFTFKTS
jgi:ABC-type glycerol-3-phosphate transport system substrate-binding protein